MLDNNGHNAWQIALGRILMEPKFTFQKLQFLDPLINIEELNLQVEQKLIKLDKSRMEFLLVNIMLAILEPNFGSGANYFKKPIFFSAMIIYMLIKNFPETLIKRFRKKRSYISSILAKNEINNNNPYNQKLFLRVKRGLYILNPELKSKVQDQWINIYKLLNFKQTAKFYEENFYEENFNVKLSV